MPVSAGPDRAVFVLQLKEGLAAFGTAAGRDGVLGAAGDGEEGAVFDVR